MRKYIVYSCCLLIIFFTIGGCDGKCTSGNCKNGFGTVEFDNGNRYVGGWKNKEPFGYGTYYFSSGNEFAGEWKGFEEKPIGQGTFKKDNYMYTGEVSLYFQDSYWTKLANFAHLSVRPSVGTDEDENGLFHFSGKNGIFYFKDGSACIGKWLSGVGIFRKEFTCKYEDGRKFIGAYYISESSGEKGSAGGRGKDPGYVPYHNFYHSPAAEGTLFFPDGTTTQNVLWHHKIVANCIDSNCQ